MPTQEEQYNILDKIYFLPDKGSKAICKKTLGNYTTNTKKYFTLKLKDMGSKSPGRFKKSYSVSQLHDIVSELLNKYKPNPLPFKKKILPMKIIINRLYIIQIRKINYNILKPTTLVNLLEILMKSNKTFNNNIIIL